MKTHCMYVVKVMGEGERAVGFIVVDRIVNDAVALVSHRINPHGLKCDFK